MASSAKKKTTFAKMTRENAVRERRLRKQAKKDDDGIVMDVVRSSAFKDFVRTAAREVARGMFKSGRR